MFFQIVINSFWTYLLIITKIFLLLSGKCHFKEYAPLGPIGEVGSVTSPTMKLGNSIDNVLNKVGQSASKAAKLGGMALKLGHKFFGKCPTLGPLLAVFSFGKNILRLTKRKEKNKSEIYMFGVCL